MSKKKKTRKRVKRTMTMGIQPKRGRVGKRRHVLLELSDDLALVRGDYCKTLRPKAKKIHVFCKSRMRVVFKADTNQEVIDFFEKVQAFDDKANELKRLPE